MPTTVDEYQSSTLDFFVKEKVLRFDEARFYYQESLKNGQLFLTYLTVNNILSEYQIAEQFSKNFHLSFVNLDNLEKEQILTHLLDLEQIKKYRLLPLNIKDNYLFVATDNPLETESFVEIQFQLSLFIKPIVVETLKLSLFIESLCNHQDELEQFKIAFDDFHREEEATYLAFIDKLLQTAITQKVSDIHLEGCLNEYRIRYRKDGLLKTIRTIPLNAAIRIITAIKLKANLDIAEKRLPQDGSFKRNKVDLRISTCPTISGEKLVIRILNNDLTHLSIDNLNLNIGEKDIFIEALNKPQGLILVTGPTGSGKTTTLYSALQYLNQEQKNVVSIEDPIEMHITGINQIAINTKANLDFSTILRAILRQDPDVIMIGEIRDSKTAEIAIKAALTGHLVLSTLHANNAIESITRLLNLGINQHDLAKALSLIIAQRLVRKICSCQSACKHCIQGYQGRLALFEFFPCPPLIQDFIFNGANQALLLEKAKSLGMKTLQESALEKINLGQTSIEEVKRVIAYV